MTFSQPNRLLPACLWLLCSLLWHLQLTCHSIIGHVFLSCAYAADEFGGQWSLNHDLLITPINLPMTLWMICVFIIDVERSTMPHVVVLHSSNHTRLIGCCVQGRTFDFGMTNTRNNPVNVNYGSGIPCGVAPRAGKNRFLPNDSVAPRADILRFLPNEHNGLLCTGMATASQAIVLMLWH